LLIATAQPWDDEMRQRIERHQVDRAGECRACDSVEEPLALAEAIAATAPRIPWWWSIA
jgi:adenosylcobinamide kinase/adenosylcobinamide-phosphate guanylyltransferase